MSGKRPILSLIGARTLCVDPDTRGDIAGMLLRFRRSRSFPCGNRMSIAPVEGR
jgi:hypothetical protein